jgi:hypothetical protein
MQKGTPYRETYDTLSRVRSVLGIVFVAFFAVYFLMMSILSGIPAFSNALSLFVAMIVAVVLFLLLAKYFFKPPHVLGENCLIVRNNGIIMEKREIPYKSIKMVVTNPSYFSSIIIRYTDINGKEKIATVTPQRKKDFLAELGTKISDPRKFMNTHEMTAALEAEKRGMPLQRDSLNRNWMRIKIIALTALVFLLLGLGLLFLYIF